MSHSIMFNFDLSVHALWGGPHRPALYDWWTRTVWLKISKLKILWKQRHTAWMPLR